MNVRRFRFSQDWAAGAFSGTRLDSSVNVSNTYSHPSIVPGSNITSTTALSGDQLLDSTTDTLGGLPQAWLIAGGATPAWTAVDQYMLTSVSGDGLALSTTAQQVTLYLSGIATSGAGAAAGTKALTGRGTAVGLNAGVQSGSGLSAGQIRNGAIATIYVNNVVVGQVDTANTASATTIYGLIGTNQIKVTHSGATNAAIISAIAAVVGTSVSSALRVTRQSPGTTIKAEWRVVAQSSATWKIQKNTGTVASPVWTDQVTGLAVGALDTTHVNGCTVTIPAGTALTTGDTAYFTTDSSWLAIEAVVQGYGSGLGSGSYTTPIMDGGASSTQWFLAEWVQSTPLLSVTVGTGNTPTPDSSWQTSTLSDRLFLQNITLPDAGTTMGLVGLGATQRGRYCQITLQFVSALVTPFVRDMSVFYSVPELDPQIMGKIPMGVGCAPGPNGLALGQTLACHLTARRQDALDYVASFGVATAIDQYLAGYGADVGLAQYTGEPPQAYRARVLGALTSSQQGGSAPYIKSMLALLVLGDQTKSSQIGISQSGRSYTVTIPTPTLNPVSRQTEYPGMPGLPTGSGSLSQTIISTFVSSVLDPVGASPTVTFL